MSWIISWQLCFMSQDQKFEIIGDIERLKTRVDGLRSSEFVKHLKVHRIAEEVNINDAYPDYYGGDDSGGCP